MKARSSTPTRLLRASALLLVFFAAGHTFGFLAFKAPSPEGRAVFDSMNAVQFATGGQSLSYGGFYRGFGLSVSAYLLFTAFLAWRLGDIANTHAQLAASLTRALLVLQLTNSALAFTCFAGPPQVLSIVVVLVVAAAAWRLGRAEPGKA